MSEKYRKMSIFCSAFDSLKIPEFLLLSSDFSSLVERHMHTEYTFRSRTGNIFTSRYSRCTSLYGTIVPSRPRVPYWLLFLIAFKAPMPEWISYHKELHIVGSALMIQLLVEGPATPCRFPAIHKGISDIHCSCALRQNVVPSGKHTKWYWSHSRFFLSAMKKSYKAYINPHTQEALKYHAQPHKHQTTGI